jgi:hypothetical protein
MRTTTPFVGMAIAAAVAAAPPPAARGAEPPRASVALDLGALDGEGYRRLDALKLEERVVLRLVQEGFAVVKPAARPQILLRLTVAADRVLIEPVEPPTGQAREVALAAGPARELEHLEIAQKIVELARAARAALRPADEGGGGPGAAAGAGGASGAAAADTAARAAPAPRAIEIAVGGAAVIRGSETGAAGDALGRLDARYGAPGGGVGVRAGAAFSPASGGGVDVREWTLQAGVGVRVPLGPRTSFEAATIGGLLVHGYALSGGAPGAAGTRTDLLASLPLVLAHFPWTGVGVELRLAPGAAGRGRRHERDGDPLWRRGALRLELGVGLVGRL